MVDATGKFVIPGMSVWNVLQLYVRFVPVLYSLNFVLGFVFF